MKKREADFGLLFRKWVRANPLGETSHFELKQTQKDSIPFSCVETQQIDFGRSIMENPKGILIRNLGGNGEPDYSYFYRDPVYIVIKFPDCFCILSLPSFISERDRSKRKSLTAQRAREIATWYEPLGGVKKKSGRLFDKR